LDKNSAVLALFLFGFLFVCMPVNYPALLNFIIYKSDHETENNQHA
jgi:hypothetical protein